MALRDLTDWKTVLMKHSFWKCLSASFSICRALAIVSNIYIVTEAVYTKTQPSDLKAIHHDVVEVLLCHH